MKNKKVLLTACLSFTREITKRGHFENHHLQIIRMLLKEPVVLEYPQTYYIIYIELIIIYLSYNIVPYNSPIVHKLLCNKKGKK